MALTDEQRREISAADLDIRDNGDGTLTVMASAIVTSMAGAGEDAAEPAEQ